MSAPWASAVRELHARAVGQFHAGAPARALRTLRTALEVLEREGATSGREYSRLAARLWISVALDESEVHGVDAAFAAIKVAETHASSAADPAIDVLLHAQLGVIEMRRNRLDAALGYLSSALSLAAYAEPIDECRMLINRGTLHMYQGSLKLAETDLARAKISATRLNDTVLERKASHNLGYLEFLTGNLPNALGMMEDARRIDPKMSAGVSLLDRARVLVECGLLSEATRVLLDATNAFRAEHRGQDLGEAYLELARCSLTAGDIAASRRYAAQARDRFRRRGNDAWRRSAELLLLQGDLAAGRPGLRLSGPALRLRDEFEIAGLALRSRSAALVAAEALLAADRPLMAADVLRSVARPSGRDPISGRLHHSYVRARVEQAEGRSAAAARAVRGALGQLSAYQSSFGSIDLQTASAVHGRRLAELGIELALEGGRPGAVLVAAERARAVSSRISAVRPPSDPVAAELLAELRQTVESLRGAQQDGRATVSLLRKRRELETQITARRWTLAGSGDVRPTASVTQIRASLGGQGGDMVMYVEAAGMLHAVCVSAERVRLRAIGPAAPVVELVRRARADLDVLAQPRLPGGLRAAVRGSCERSLAALDEALVRPLGVGGRRLVILSTGVLGQLPWGALPSLRGVPVVVAPSATAWLTASSEQKRDGLPEVLAIAGPDLERAEDEVAGIRGAWPNAQALVGEAADRMGVARAVSKGVAVAHVAAHGVHQTENPLFSSLRLADGPMFAHELDQTARTPEHVILSACELGLATVRPGDEALGLTSVLLHLGTRSVVAGVARVGDDVAAETMIAYHRGLAAGRDSAEALAEALAGLDAEQPAPFVCFGSTWGI